MPLGRFDQRVFCGLPAGNCTFALPAVSRVVSSICADATMRAVASAGELAGAAGVPRCATRAAVTMTNRTTVADAIRCGEAMAQCYPRRQRVADDTGVKIPRGAA